MKLLSGPGGPQSEPAPNCLPMTADACSGGDKRSPIQVTGARGGGARWQTPSSAPPRGSAAMKDWVLTELRGPAPSRSGCSVNLSPLRRGRPLWGYPGAWGRSRAPLPQGGSWVSPPFLLRRRLTAPCPVPSPPGTQTHSGPIAKYGHLSVRYLLSIFHASNNTVQTAPMKYEWIEVLTSK